MTFPRAHLPVNDPRYTSIPIRKNHPLLPGESRSRFKETLWERDLETCALNSLNRGWVLLTCSLLLKVATVTTTPSYERLTPSFHWYLIRALDLVIRNCQVSIICTISVCPRISVSEIRHCGNNKFDELMSAILRVCQPVELLGLNGECLEKLR